MKHIIELITLDLILAGYSPGITHYSPAVAVKSRKYSVRLVLTSLES
jgi:hypothetical protein